jgi:hypothetical protein
MTIIDCRECAEQIYGYASTYPKCGLSQISEKKNRSYTGLLFMLITIVALGVI